MTNEASETYRPVVEFGIAEMQPHKKGGWVPADHLKAAVREAYERGVREAAETIRERWASSNAELETHVLALLDKEPGA